MIAHWELMVHSLNRKKGRTPKKAGLLVRYQKSIGAVPARQWQRPNAVPWRRRKAAAAAAVVVPAEEGGGDEEGGGGGDGAAAGSGEEAAATAGAEPASPMDLDPAADPAVDPVPPDPDLDLERDLQLAEAAAPPRYRALMQLTPSELRIGIDDAISKLPGHVKVSQAAWPCEGESGGSVPV